MVAMQGESKEGGVRETWWLSKGATHAQKEVSVSNISPHMQWMFA